MTAVRAVLLPLYLALCLVLGGASNGGFVANLVLQLLALTLLVAVFWRPPQQSFSRPEGGLAWALFAAALLAAVQFLPLPRGVWAASDARVDLLAQSELAAVSLSPLLVALAPFEALASLVWALPAAALGVALLRWRSWQAEHLAWVIVGVMAVSVGLGAAQLAGGSEAAAYFYAVTNRDMTVGFFANANHLASLLLVSLPFLAALAKTASARGGASATAIHLGVAGLALVALVGIVANGSLAGYGLLLPVLAASAAILVPARLSRRLTPLVLFLAVAGGAALVLASDELSPMVARAEAFSPGARDVIWATTWQAIGDFMPLGSGLGSFAEVYRLYEDPALVQAALVNHAHNDYLEVLLELGLPGALLVMGFLAWWLRRAVQVWRSGAATPFAWAAMVATATLLAHSIVDYPLRTAGLGGLFVACCVLMAGWVSSDGPMLLASSSAGADKANPLEESLDP